MPFLRFFDLSRLGITFRVTHHSLGAPDIETEFSVAVGEYFFEELARGFWKAIFGSVLPLNRRPAGQEVQFRFDSEMLPDGSCACQMLAQHLPAAAVHLSVAIGVPVAAQIESPVFAGLPF